MKQTQQTLNNISLIVLTENVWLFEGLSALLPDIFCCMVRFDAMPPERMAVDYLRVIIAVDCMIFFNGQWDVFKTLLKARPDASVVWLTRDQTGGVFPVHRSGDRIVGQKQDLMSLRRALRAMYGPTEARRYDSNRVRPVWLTDTEYWLLPYFFAGLDTRRLSAVTGLNVKILYYHRRKILEKTGFRSISFLQLVYEKNHGLPGVERYGIY